MLSNANVHLVLMDMLVAFGIDDAPGICRRLRSETLSTSKPCLITIVVKGHTSEPLDLTAKVNSEDTVLALNLLNRVRRDHRVKGHFQVLHLWFQMR